MNAVPAPTQPAPRIEADIEITDQDRDAFHILPLSILPLQHPALRRARMVKSARMDSMVEFFSSSGSGSGQVAVRDVPKLLELPVAPMHDDVLLLRKIEILPSFDVYSLRIMLRRCGIAVNDETALALSESKVRSLSGYMVRFAQPLVKEILGESVSASTYTEMLSLFRNPEMATDVRERIQSMAHRLGVDILDIPNFLEDYADVLLSLAYYRQCLDLLIPQIQVFLESAHSILDNYQLRQDRQLMETVRESEATINEMLADVSGRIENFERNTRDIWDGITAERFQKIVTAIKDYQVNIAGLLCALSVKMSAWKRLFPTPSAGGPVRRAEFIMSEMRQGISRIRALRAAAPILSDVAN